VLERDRERERPRGTVSKATSWRARTKQSREGENETNATKHGRLLAAVFFVMVVFFWLID
jgi:hypothetical protein